VRLIPVSICHYLASRFDPIKLHATGKKHKPDFAIACKSVLKSWTKEVMKNVNRLQIEIWGLKESLDTLDTLLVDRRLFN